MAALQCDFEADFCGYELTGEEQFAFAREAGKNFNNINDGPLADSAGSREHFFAYITARTSQRQGKIATIEMPMIHGANHEVECLSFWFSIKVIRQAAINPPPPPPPAQYQNLWNTESLQSETTKGVILFFHNYFGSVFLTVLFMTHTLAAFHFYYWRSNDVIDPVHRIHTVDA